MIKIRNNRGSAVVEASIAVPLFLFVLLFFFHMLHVQTVRQVIYEAGVETAEYVAEYYFLQEEAKDLLEGGTSVSDMGKDKKRESFKQKSGLVDQATLLAVAAAHLQGSLDEPSMVEKYVKGGVSGISLLGSSLPDQDGELQFTIRYTICINTPFLPTVTKDVVETIRQKTYLGYTPEEDDGSESDPFVYITDNQEVYHRSRGCSHLVLGIHPMQKEEAVEQGYRACAFCGKSAGLVVLVGPEGECYHSAADCSGLIRRVRRVRLSETGGLPPCSRCGK